MKKRIIISLLLVCIAMLTAFAQVSVYPYQEHFDTVAVPLLPYGWKTSTNKNVIGDFTSSASSARTGSGPNCINCTDARINQALISPQCNFTGKIVDSLEFYERRTSSFTAGLLIEASINNDTLFSIKLSDTLKLTTGNNSAYQRRVISLPSVLNDQSNVRFRWKIVGLQSGGGTAVLRFDDVTITTKKGIDLALNSFSIFPSSPKSGELVTAAVGIINRALQGSFSGSVQLFDSLTLIAIQNFSQTLSANDSMMIVLNYPNITSGRHPLRAQMFVNGDEDSSNNIITMTLAVGYRQRTVLINEVMYTPFGGMPEWVELVNNSPDTVPISGWKISDSGPTKAAIAPSNQRIMPHSYVIVTTDTTGLKLWYSISAPLFQAPFSTLNNSGDAVILFDPYNTVIDSVSYLSSWGGGSGKSLERMDTSISSSLQSNWNTCKNSIGATPGAINSVTQKQFDAAVTRLTFTPQNPVSDTAITVAATIKNLGRFDLSAVDITIFIDKNKDSLLTDNEQYYVHSLSLINKNDSMVVQSILPILPQGMYSIAVKISSSKDDDSLNNIMIQSLIVGIPSHSIVITEMMFAPAGDMPEWVEGYNRTSSAVNIGGWKISDNGPTKALLQNPRIEVAPHSYFIITSDSLQFKNSFPNVVSIYQAAIPALNNTTADAVVLFDDRTNAIDSVSYKPSWGGSNGYSLQRFDILSSSADSINWRSALPSPGIENIIARKDFDVEVKRISSSLYSHGSRLTAVLFNSGREDAHSVTIKFYYVRNNDSTVQTGEVLYSSMVTDILSNDSTAVTFEWNNTIPGTKRIIVTIDDVNDERIENNSATLIVTNSFAPLSFVINEIMYEPFSGNAEFVELLNRSSDTIDIADWKLMDQPGSSGNRTIIVLSRDAKQIPPGGFMLIASDSSLYSQFPYANGKTVVINPSLSLSNNGEDLVLVDLTNTQIDSVRYSPFWHIKNVSSSGRSLERIDPAVQSTDNKNWSSSAAATGSSPLQQNTIFIGLSLSSSSLSLFPNPFSPDTDGFEDFLSIRYLLPSNSSTIRVRIFDVAGRLIRRLVQNETSPSTGSVIWNGYDDNNRRVPIGMYIILFEALDNFGGTAQVMKDVAVVGRKL